MSNLGSVLNKSSKTFGFCHFNFFMRRYFYLLNTQNHSPAKDLLNKLKTKL